MRPPCDLLVLDFDGIVLRGAVVHVERKGPVEIRRHSASVAATLESALAEVAGTLGRVPTACVVLSAEVVAALVHLPIASARGRTADEIAQMLRWELEPFCAQQSAVQPLGTILEARRHLDRGAVERVLEIQRERRAAGSRDAASLRFGEVARELGLVTDEQLAEALAIQERLDRTEEDLVCGWEARTAPADASGGGLWLAAGMPASRRRWWAEQLSARGLKLLALYPRLPAAIAALDGRASATVIEVEAHAVSRSVVRNGALVSLEILPVSDVEPPESVCSELFEGVDPAEAYFCGSLAGRALAVLGRQARLFDPPLRGEAAGAPSAWAGIAGAARHASGFGGPAAAIPARDPRRPLLRRTGVRWAAAVLVVAAAAAGMDRITTRSLLRSVRELAGARERLAKVTSQIRDVEQRSADAGGIAKEIASLEQQRDMLRARLRMLDERVAVRASLLPRLLDALAGAANDDVLLDRTTEESPGRIRIEGRALSERSVQSFGRSVAGRVLPLGLRVVDQAIRKGSARGLGGHYTFSFLLEPIPEEGV